MLLERINNPKDLKNLKKEELEILVIEIRKALLNRMTNYSKKGHVGSNMGVVELTIALHYVLTSATHIKYLREEKMVLFMKKNLKQ